jgi:uncharacterized protein YtpQ (UPF0354 family)
MRSKLVIALLLCQAVAFGQEIDNSRKYKKEGIVATKHGELTMIKKLRILPADRPRLWVSVQKEADARLLLDFHGTALNIYYRIDEGDSAIILHLENGGAVSLVALRTERTAPKKDEVVNEWDNEFLVNKENLAQLKLHKIKSVTLNPKRGSRYTYPVEESMQDFIMKALELVERTSVSQ